MLLREVIFHAEINHESLAGYLWRPLSVLTLISGNTLRRTDWESKPLLRTDEGKIRRHVVHRVNLFNYLYLTHMHTHMHAIISSAFCNECMFLFNLLCLLLLLFCMILV